MCVGHYYNHYYYYHYYCDYYYCIVIIIIIIIIIIMIIHLFAVDRSKDFYNKKAIAVVIPLNNKNGLLIKVNEKSKTKYNRGINYE